MAYDDLSSDYSEDFEDEEVTSSIHDPESNGHSHGSIPQVDEQYYSSGYHSTGRTRTGGSVSYKPPATKSTAATSPTRYKDRENSMRKSHGGVKKKHTKTLSVGKSPAGQSPRDRLLSAKQHAVKDLQSRLSTASQLCDELKKENKLLKTLQVRQERELEKYQNQEGELPQILQHHSEEVRTLKEQLKRSQASLAVHQTQLKDTQQRLVQMSEKTKKLDALVKKKGLQERDMLTYQLQEAQMAIANKDRRISDLEKSAELTTKSYQREIGQLRSKNKSLNTEIKQHNDQYKQLCHQLKEKERDLDVLNIYSKRITRTNTTLNFLPLPVYTEDIGTLTEISYPTSESLTVSMTTSPRDQYSNTANYSPCQPTGSIFQSTPSYPQGSIVNESPQYSTADSPRESIPQQHISTNVTPRQSKPTEHVTNFSPTVQSSASPVQASKQESRESNREEMLRLEELQRKEAEEKLHLQEEKAKSDKIAEEKRREEEKRKQLLLARLKEIDNQTSSQPAPSQPSDTKPHVETVQPAKKKRLEDILNDGTAQEKNDLIDVPVTKPAPSTNNTSEEKRKKDLLAQLLSSEDTQDDDGLTAAVGSSTSIKSAGSTGSSYKWNSRIENMHHGKPAMAGKDDPFGKRASAGPRKDSLSLLDDNSTTSKSSIPHRKKSDGGLDFLGGTGGTMNTNVDHSHNNDTPTFGRRANQKPHPVFGNDIDILSTNESSLPLKTDNTTTAASSKTYPWEREIDLVNDHGVTEFNSNNTFTDSLLPRRAKAQPLNIGSMPGQIDDDIEELSLV